MHGEAWEKSLWLKGNCARLQKPVGSRGDLASWNCSAKVLYGVQNPSAAALWRGSIHVVHMDVHGWTRGLTSAEAESCLPALGRVTRGRAQGQACEPRGAVRPAPLNDRAFAREPFGAVWGPARGKAAGADTCALCAPRESPESGAGKAISRCPLSPPRNWGSPSGSERRSGGAPQHFGQGLGAGTPTSSPHLRGGGGCAQPPASPGLAGVVKASIWEQSAKKPCGRNFLYPLPSPSWTPEGYEGEGGKKGREGGKRGG